MMYSWYEEQGGIRHVAAYLDALDLAGFDPKAPPPKTQAWWDIIDANRAPEDAELADILDALGNPDAVTLEHKAKATGDFYDWLGDRRNRRSIPHRSTYAAIRPFAAIRGRTACGSSKKHAKSFMPKKALSIRGRFEARSAFKGLGGEQGVSSESSKSSDPAPTFYLPRVRFAI